MGSGIYATMSYKLDYDKANIVIKQSKGPYGELNGPMYAYNVYKKPVKYDQDPVFIINQGHNLQYQYNRHLAIKLERFNKMLRLYNSKDDLEIKKTELQIACKQLNEINSKIESKTFDYLNIDDKFKLKLDKLRNNYKEVHQKLKQETREAKQRNIKQLNKVKKNCIEQAKQAVEKKKQYIDKADRVLTRSSDAALYNKLKQISYELDQEIVVKETYNKNHTNYIKYEYDLCARPKILEFPDLDKYVIRTWKDTQTSEYYENIQYIRDFIAKIMNDIKKKRVSYKESNSVVNQSNIQESSDNLYDSASHTDQ
jgi:hypothetical protein